MDDLLYSFNPSSDEGIEEKSYVVLSNSSNSVSVVGISTRSTGVIAIEHFVIAFVFASSLPAQIILTVTNF